jgi:hypothetical protein
VLSRETGYRAGQLARHSEREPASPAHHRLAQGQLTFLEKVQWFPVPTWMTLPR